MDLALWPVLNDVTGLTHPDSVPCSFVALALPKLVLVEGGFIELTL